jgi:hypothetical protein
MKPKGVMVWCGVGYDAKAPLIFVQAGVKIDTDVYRRTILRPVRNWAEEHYGVDEEGEDFKISVYQSNCLQVTGTIGLFNKTALLLTQARTTTQNGSEFRLKGGATKTFRTSFEKTNGHLLLQI